MPMMSASRRCVLFTKPARPGLVKTRLHPVLSPAQAARLHQAFLDDLVPRLSKGDFELVIAWALGADEPLPASDLPAIRQRGGDLGERLHRGLAEAAEGPDGLVVAIGGDHPELATTTVEGAFDRLADGSDIVIGPAEDGGYYLIGLGGAALSSRLFEDIAWGESSVLATTLERCRALGLDVETLPTGRDVDVPEDLDRLTELLRADTGSCPATERLLRRWGRLS